ncbi:ectoine/hydroxyectoine ABC transporter substrate-binding protein EhuB [Bosea sp. 2YAB26]|uniref:ectoine/hydroxyectoine ABC transporter substrate-binding protein EhuB n=1 Tax=unclassified Bosea (in: a-proteobacteria) TaxID=2653178 RepID=UPI003F8FB993
MKITSRTARVANALASALIVSAALSFPTIAHADSLSSIKSEGYARVGFSNFTPWGYVDDKGELSGVEPTLVRAFLKSIGVDKMDGVVTQFVSIIPALDAKRLDFIGAGMQIRPGRCQQIAFGEPEWVSTQGFVTKAGNPSKLTSLDDVKSNAATRLAVVAGGTEREYARINGIPDAQVVIFPDLPTAASGIKAGRVDAMMQTSITIRGLLAGDKHPELAYVAMSKPPLDKDGNPVIGYGAVGFRKSDPELLAAWNAWLKGAKQSGEIVRLLEPFGFTAADIAPDTIKTADLCAAKN